MIHLLDFEIVENPPDVEAKWKISARFVDTEDINGYDKMFSMAGGKLKDMLRKAEYQCSVVCSAPDPRDTDALTIFFREYRP